MFKSSNNRDMAKTNEPHSPEQLNRIVAGTQIEGVIISDSNIRIDGTVKGTITAKGRLVIGPTGEIKGEVKCENADIEGVLTGNIVVNGLLSLKSTARLECDITTKKLAIEPGAVFSGKCVMGGGVVKDLKQTVEDQERERSHAAPHGQAKQR